MNAQLRPLVSVDAADSPGLTPSLPLWHQGALRSLLDQDLPLVQRAPSLEDEQRWTDLELGGRQHRFAQPITFTPYASAQPCSARCQFCSENLRTEFAGVAAAQLRPAPNYFQGLAAVLAKLNTLPLSWSLSGLESSDDADWMLRLLSVLSAAEVAGLKVESRVLYSNLAGIAGTRGDALVEALHSFGLSWVEVSRHHYDERPNQAIMRFREGQGIVLNEAFAHTLGELRDRVPFKLVCVVQRGGVASAEAVQAYLDWAWRLGAEQVIFRELARMQGGYRPNATARYISTHRIDVGELLTDCLAQGGFRAQWQPSRFTRGYYFSNVVLSDRFGREIVFEAADYGDMQQMHASDRIYKLIYFANGELSADWQPGRHTLWTFDG